MDYLINGDAYLASRPGFKLIGRQKELRKLSAILMRSKANSVVLVGPGGVGCTALCIGLQASKQDPDVPFDIVSKRFFWLDVDSLFSSGNATETNDAFKRVLGTLYRTVDSVLVIEDTKDFLEAVRNNGCTHFLNALFLAVRSDKTQCIFECRDDDLDMVLKTHSDLRECFTIMDVTEPQGEELQAIVTGAALNLSVHHGISVADDAARAAVELTSKYRVRDMGLSRAQPERAVTLIDRALASFRLDAHGAPDPLVQAELKKLHRLQKEAEQALTEVEDRIETEKRRDKEKRTDAPGAAGAFAGMAQAAGFESEAVQTLVARQKAIQAEVDANRNEFDRVTATVNADLALTRDLVLSEFSRISGISVNKLNENEREKLKKLEDAVKQKVFGQDEAVHRISNAVKVARVGRRNQEKPTAFLLLGPSGVGKTEIAKVLTTFLYDDERALMRFDMSEYMEKHAVARLIGAPPGYEGFDVGGALTNAGRKNPNGSYLFDEIEKAHDDVFNVFLQVLDAGRLTDNVGRLVDFRSSLMIMTTNIGQVHFLDQSLSFEEARARAIEELNSRYRSEFLNRFSGRENIICFNRLGIDSIERIVRREIISIGAAYDTIMVTMTDGALKSFCRDHYDPKIGARGLPGYIQANLDPILAGLILESPDASGTLEVGYDEAKKVFTTTLLEAERAAA